MIQHAAVISQGIAFILQIAPRQKMQLKANIMYHGYFLVSGTQSSSLWTVTVFYFNTYVLEITAVTLRTTKYGCIYICVLTKSN